MSDNTKSIDQMDLDELTLEASKLSKKESELVAWYESILKQASLVKDSLRIIEEEKKKRIPNYKVDVYGNTHITIEIGIKGNTYPFYRGNIPNFNKGKSGFWEVYKTEIWRLPPILNTLEGVWISEPAKLMIQLELDKRKELSLLREQEDIEWEVPGFRERGIELHPFQKICGRFMELVDFNGLNANQMGLGKTLNTIGVVVKNQLYPALVICPATVRTNWEREIYRAIGEPAYVLFGETPNDYDIGQLVFKNPKFILLTYDSIAGYEELKYDKKNEEDIRVLEEKTVYLYSNMINKFVKPKVIICDEMHYIKNDASRRNKGLEALECKQVMGLTGTPVVNRPDELYAILHKIDPKTFDSKYQFMSQYSDGKNGVRNVTQLYEVLQKYMIRYLTKDVFKQLPPVTSINEYVTLNAKYRKTYDKVQAGIMEFVMADGTVAAANITGVLAQIMRLKQVCTLAKIQRAADLAMEIYDSADESDKHKKVIIFSQFVNLPAAVREIHKRLSPESVMFTGQDNVQDRQFTVDKFQSDPNVHFLCCSTKAAAEGLNITAAGSVIFVDLMWTPKDHQQAIGRAYGRISDSHHVNAYYVLAKDTIDEWIEALIREKMEMIEKVVDGVERTRIENTSIAQELFKKMRGK